MSIVLRVAAACATLLLSAPAFSTTVIRAPLQELAKSSDVIVHARVRAVDDDRSTSANGPFETGISLELVEVMRGLEPSARTLELVLPGGRAKGRVMVIPGMPRFNEGDEVVLLLERTPRGSLALTGLWQGVFHVDYQKGAAVVVPHDHGDGHFVNPDGTTSAQDPYPVPKRLDDLLTALRGYVAEGGQR